MEVTVASDKVTKWQHSEGLRWNRSQQEVNLGLTEEADASTCLVGPVILLCINSECKMLAPAKSVHYASEAPLELFWYPFWMNLRPMRPCAIIKGIEWLKIMHP